jgi:PQQ-dependent dehydrogenase (methanol/ethanol family)
MNTLKKRRRRIWSGAGLVTLTLATWFGIAGAQNRDWPYHGGDLGNTRYSPLDQINTSNVSGLRVLYSLQLGALRANEDTPIVIGDTMYVASSWGPKYVYAIDARNGAKKWVYDSKVPESVMPYACCDVDTRGVAYANGKIFVGQLDGNLVALDASTGKLLWKTKVVEYKEGKVITSPPTVIGNKVITGFAGGEYGVRGALQAYDADTGKLIWRTYTIPGPGEPGNETWKGDSWKHGGGSTWLVGSYDPKLNILYWGTSNPGPWNTAVRGPGTSDYGKFTNLYTSSVLALDPDTGRIKWHIQYTPHDAWDYDGVNESVLADLTIDGQKVPVLMHADRNGFFYVANRETGKLISARPYVYVNWAEGIDPRTGRPIEIADKRPTLQHKATDICPSLFGGKDWQPMSYSPQTGLVYISSNNMCMDMKDVDIDYHQGMFYLGNDFQITRGHGDYLGRLIAWDPVNQKEVWGINERFPYNGGIISTGGGLLFYGTFDGWFRAVDAKAGKILWQFAPGTGVNAAPLTYQLDGKQYVAVVVGRPQSAPSFMGEIGKEMLAATPQGGALFVFGLGS